ncbi:hypothetical protein SB6408_02062 [Klebsiella spallanzanii]|uniref:Uncharacterized protein n=1 Tax=Klebsiella spallanzanii TaxID=2587528 RepID=A0A564NBG0_9ENTR|nr:hypothetical protein SB6408_02062 [Klebsiella spallanzanii]
MRCTGCWLPAMQPVEVIQPARQLADGHTFDAVGADAESSEDEGCSPEAGELF